MKTAQTNIDRFLDEHIPTLSLSLVQFWRDQQTATSLVELQRAIENGLEFETLLNELAGDYERLCKTGTLAQGWREAVTAGAEGSRVFIDEIIRQRNVQKRKSPSTVSKAEYDPVPEEIEDWIEQHGAELVVEITEGQRTALREAIRQGYERNMSVRELAAIIRPVIGLTARQVRANLNYYAHVFDTLAVNNPYLSEREMNRRAAASADRYAQRQLRERAKTIAVTELAYAYNRGTHAAMRQAQRQGRVGVLEKIWSCADDERSCAACDQLNGNPVGFDGEFFIDEWVDGEKYTGRPGSLVHAKAGPEITPPAHPRCRCTLMYREIEPPKELLNEQFMDFPDIEFIKPDFAPDVLTDNPTGGDNEVKSMLQYIREDGTFDKETAKKDFIESLKSMPEKNKIYLLQSMDAVEYVERPLKTRAFAYDPDDDEIVYNPEHPAFPRYAFDVVNTHELGHRIDHVFVRSWQDKAFSAAIEAAKQVPDSIWEECLVYSWENDEDGFLSDIFSALCENRFIFRANHDRAYWLKPTKKEKEIFANLFSLEVMNKREYLNFLKSKFPAVFDTYANLDFSV